MRTKSIILKHLSGYDSRYAPFYRQYTAEKVVVFSDTAVTEKGHHKSRMIVYFFPRFSRLLASPNQAESFANAGIQPGDIVQLNKDTQNSWTIVKITPLLIGSDCVEHYRLECVQ